MSNRLSLNFETRDLVPEIVSLLGPAAAAIKRDDGVCQGCGLRDTKPLTINLSGQYRNPDDYETVCAFCKLVCNAHRLSDEHDCQLIYWPELSQAELNRTLISAYLELYCLDDPTGLAKACIDGVAARSERVVEMHGTARASSVIGDGGDLGDLRLFPGKRLLDVSGSHPLNKLPEHVLSWGIAKGCFSQTALSLASDLSELAGLLNVNVAALEPEAKKSVDFSEFEKRKYLPRKSPDAPYTWDLFELNDDGERRLAGAFQGVNPFQSIYMYEMQLDNLLLLMMGEPRPIKNIGAGIKTQTIFNIRLDNDERLEVEFWLRYADDVLSPSAHLHLIKSPAQPRAA